MTELNNINLRLEDLRSLLIECARCGAEIFSQSHSGKSDQLWFNTRQAAEKIGVSVSTINRWKRMGGLACKSIGGRDYFSLESITEFKNGNGNN